MHHAGWENTIVLLLQFLLSKGYHWRCAEPQDGREQTDDAQDRPWQVTTAMEKSNTGACQTAHLHEPTVCG
jgi:hypothetical protein